MPRVCGKKESRRNPQFLTWPSKRIVLLTTEASRLQVKDTWGENTGWIWDFYTSMGWYPVVRSYLCLGERSWLDHLLIWYVQPCHGWEPRSVNTDREGHHGSSLGNSNIKKLYGREETRRGGWKMVPIL